jgi:hypothetical protein
MGFLPGRFSNPSQIAITISQSAISVKTNRCSSQTTGYWLNFKGLRAYRVRSGWVVMFFLGSVRLWCYAAFAAGIGFSLFALGDGIYFLNFRSRSLVTTGIVTTIDVQSDADGNLYCPHVRFEALNGKTYTAACRIWGKGRAPTVSVGDSVSIRYSPGDPNKAFPEAQVNNVPRLEASIGICALCLGFAFRWYAAKRKISLKPLSRNR